MKKLNYFYNREDCVEFLKQFNFKYFVPYVHKNELEKGTKRYHVELNKEFNKIVWCSVEFIEGNLKYNDVPFYDNKHAYDFETIEQGERKVKEYRELDMNYYI